MIMLNSTRSHQVDAFDSRVKMIFLLLSILVGCITGLTGTQELSSDYEKINDYLIKNINSIEPSINMDALEKWASATCCKDCRSRQYVEGYYTRAIQSVKPTYCVTLERLIGLLKIIHGESCNQEGANTLVEFDSDLGDITQSNPDNYPYRRIERIIEHYTYDWSERCLDSGCCERSRLPYLFKERAYDQINSYLVNQTKSDDIHLNMARADEYLQSLMRAPPEQEGVKTDSLSQFMAIKSVADEKLCDGQDFEIILKNDLATGGSACTNKIHPIRRIDKLVHHYSLKNAKLCQPVYRKKFEDRIQLLDETTYRNALTLVGVQMFSPNNDTNLGASIKSMKVGSKFYNNSMEVDELMNNSVFKDREPPSSIIQRCLLISAQGDPEAIYLGRVPDEISGEYVVVEEKVRELFDKYLLKPCQNFINTLRKEASRLSSYAKIIDDDDDQNKNFQTEVASAQTYYLASAVYKTCCMVVNNSENIILNLIASYPPVAGKSSFYDTKPIVKHNSVRKFSINLYGN